MVGVGWGRSCFLSHHWAMGNGHTIRSQPRESRNQEKE